MKFSVGTMIISSCFILNIFAMDITVTREFEEHKSFTREVLIQSDIQKGKYVMVCRVLDKETQKISYCGVTGDLIWNQENGCLVPEMMVNQSWLGDFYKPKNPAYQKLEAFWHQLNEQAKS